MIGGRWGMWRGITRLPLSTVPQALHTHPCCHKVQRPATALQIQVCQQGDTSSAHSPQHREHARPLFLIGTRHMPLPALHVSTARACARSGRPSTFPPPLLPSPLRRTACMPGKLVGVVAKPGSPAPPPSRLLPARSRVAPAAAPPPAAPPWTPAAAFPPPPFVAPSPEGMACGRLHVQRHLGPYTEQVNIGYLLTLLLQVDSTTMLLIRAAASKIVISTLDTSCMAGKVRIYTSKMLSGPQTSR